MAGKPKLLPSDVEVEKSVLCSIFSYPDNRQQAIATLIPDDFYQLSHKTIFEACRALHESGRAVGLDTVYAELSEEQRQLIGGAVYLSKLLKEPPAIDIKYSADILRQKRALRNAFKFSNAIEKIALRNNGNLSDIKNHAKSILTEIEAVDAERSSGGRFQFVHNAQLLESLQPVEWRIHGILEDRSFYYTFGEAGSYKTFVELDRLLCIASGIDYHGHKTKQGVVFYIAGEGQQGIGRRIAAWMIHHGLKAKNVPFFVAKTPMQLMDPSAVDEVKRAVDRLSAEYGFPAVIHIDTLARNFGDGDENATKDMNRVISNLDAAFGNDFTRGLTHHSGHGNKDRARGAYALHAAADAAFRIEYRADGKILVQAKKAKDAPLAPPMLFNRTEIKLMIGNQFDSSFVLELDSEGDDVCILPEIQSKKISGSMSDALSILRKMYVEHEKNLAADGRDSQLPSVSKTDWRQACIQQKTYKKAANFERAVERMLLRNLIFLDDQQIYVYPIDIYQKYNCGDF